MIRGRWRLSWEQRIDDFVDARSEAARQAGRGPDGDGDLADAHRALAEGAWYVLELSRQRPELAADKLRRAGAQVLDRWEAGTEPRDRERWAAADWALWVRSTRGGLRGGAGRGRRPPVPGDLG